MIPPNGQHHPTLAYASAALEQIARNGQAADPRSYALWYRYAAGESGLLKEAINIKLAHSGRLSAQDVDDLYESHVAPQSIPAKVDRVRARITDEIEQVMAMITSAEETMTGYSSSLSDATRRLHGMSDRDGVRAIVEALLASTREMAAANSELQMRYQALGEEVAQLRRELDALRLESQTDPLTSLGNRRFFAAALDRLLDEARRANEPLSLLLADVDRFKQINDTYGNVVGDRVLRFIATTFKESITGRDVACRYNGDELAVIMPKSTLPLAVRTAEQLRHSIMKCKLIRRSTGEGQERVTISFGVATIHKNMCAQALIEGTELCLYAAKRAGRNCVIAETDEKLFSAVAGSTLSIAAAPLMRQ